MSLMRTKDTSDVMLSVLAIICDASAVFGGFMLAAWIRFDSGWIPIIHAPPPHVYRLYAFGAGVATLLSLFIFQTKALYVRPQTGSFTDKIPRLLKAVGLSILLSTVLAFAFKNEIIGPHQTDFARLVLGISLFSISFFLVLERYILFRIEWNLARHSRNKRNVLILGTDSVAFHVKRSLYKEPMLRAQTVGFLRTNLKEADSAISEEMLLGTIEEFGTIVETHKINEVILTDSDIGHTRIVDILLQCE
ncbi:hypothetical protein H8D64_01175 [PVC group bacterium]|nr:hypothetical protein [PVC group bacterium]